MPEDIFECNGMGVLRREAFFVESSYATIRVVAQFDVVGAPVRGALRLDGKEVAVGLKHDMSFHLEQGFHAIQLVATGRDFWCACGTTGDGFENLQLWTIWRRGNHTQQENGHRQRASFQTVAFSVAEKM